MKFEGTRPSRVDKDYTVYTFAMGQDEMILLYGLLNSFVQNMPSGIVDMMPTYGRARNTKKVIGDVLSKFKVQRKRSLDREWHPKHLV